MNIEHKVHNSYPHFSQQQAAKHICLRISQFYTTVFSNQIMKQAVLWHYVKPQNFFNCVVTEFFKWFLEGSAIVYI